MVRGLNLGSSEQFDEGFLSSFEQFCKGHVMGNIDIGVYNDIKGFRAS